MDKNRLDGLLALSLVARKKNFTAAAEELGISPPAISKMIKQLEKRMGVVLLSRTTRSTSLTEAGERFLSEAGPALDQILSAMDHAGAYAEKPSGVLRINLSRSMYPSLMRPLITSFAKTYPEVTVELFFDDELSDVVEGRFDAGIRPSETMAKDMVALKLVGPIRYVVVGAPKYLNKHGRPKHPQELHLHNCIRMSFGEGDMYDRWEFEHKGKDFQVQVTGTLILNDTALAVNAALDGMGLVYTAENLISDAIASKKLEVVLEQYAAKDSGFYLYFPKRSQVQPKLRAFIEHIKSEQKTLR
ncbi:MAG: LysR family transcriptional regulator [Bdellovibrionia bacterium]